MRPLLLARLCILVSKIEIKPSLSISPALSACEAYSAWATSRHRRRERFPLETEPTRHQQEVDFLPLIPGGSLQWWGRLPGRHHSKDAVELFIVWSAEHYREVTSAHFLCFFWLFHLSRKLRAFWPLLPRSPDTKEDSHSIIGTCPSICKNCKVIFKINKCRFFLKMTNLF